MKLQPSTSHFHPICMQPGICPRTFLQVGLIRKHQFQLRHGGKELFEFGHISASACTRPERSASAALWVRTVLRDCLGPLPLVRLQPRESGEGKTSNEQL